VTDGQVRLLSDDSIEAIAEIATSVDDIKAVFASVGIRFKLGEVLSDANMVYAPGIRSHTRVSLEALDLGDPGEVGRVLQAIPRIVELHQASNKADGTKLVRLRMALEADGFRVGHTGDFAAAFSDLALSAGAALSDFTGIRAEISRLEKAVPDDPGAAIGRAKNLVEATAKAVLAYRGMTVDIDDALPALAAKAMEELSVHPKQASAELEQVRRLLGRLQGMVQDLAELRNDVGDGHGNATVPQALDGRHGRLAVWSALGWCSYMLDTLNAMPTAPTS
jgi:Abortive infection C-terminus